jgi:hypothetical protein
MKRWNELLFLTIERLNYVLDANKQIFPAGLFANSENIRVRYITAIENREDVLNKSDPSPCIYVTWLGNTENNAVVNQFIGVYVVVDADNQGKDMYARNDALAGYLSSHVIGALHNWKPDNTPSVPTVKFDFSPLQFLRENAPYYTLESDKGSKARLAYNFIFQTQCKIEKRIN